MGDRCVLCANLTGHKSVEYWNRPLFESHNYVVLPSLGALVEGWLLIVPKSHFICVGAISQKLVEELHQLKTTLAQLLTPIYGPLVAFEHGPNRTSCDIGCGVDHAHLHLVPYTYNLKEAVGRFLPENTEWTLAGPTDCANAFTNNEDYLYFEQPLGFGRHRARVRIQKPALPKSDSFQRWSTCRVQLARKSAT